MLQQTSKKIIFFFFLFLFLGTVSNKYLSNLEFPKINSFIVSGIDLEEKNDIIKKLEYLKASNLIFLDKSLIEQKMNSNENIETFSIFKKYPSTLQIKIKKTKILAKINVNGKDYLIGSNGKLIDKKIPINIPQIYGNLDIEELLKFKEILDNSYLDFDNIKNLFFYPSKRWDIETIEGVYIKLPKKEIKQSLILINNLIENKEFEKIKMIDLRQNKQLVVNER